MNIITVDDLRLASKASLYFPSMEVMQPILNMNHNAMANIIQTADHATVHEAISFSNHYMSDDVFDQIADISNEIGYSGDHTSILYNGDLENMNDLSKLALIHDKNIYDMLQDNTIHGYGYEFSEPLEDTALYNNINGNVAHNYRDMELYVDSSEYDIDLKSYLNLSDIIEDAYKIINDQDFTKDSK